MAIKINKQEKSIEIKCTIEDNPVIYNYFSNMPDESRDESFVNALHIGVLAMEEDRISAFLAKTKNQLGCELEELGRRYDSSAKIKEVQEKSAGKGTIAENDIARFLAEYIESRSWQDEVQQTGSTTGNIRRNKTGDIVCIVSGTENKIVIECKFNKTVMLGDIASVKPLDKDLSKDANDTAWSQLMEAEANRDGIPIIVFDRKFVHNSITKECRNVSFVPGIGFIAIIDSETDRYENLFIAYDLARDIASHPCSSEVDTDCLNFLINGLVRDINRMLEIEGDIKVNFQNSYNFTKTVLGKLKESQLMLETNKKYLSKYLETGKLTKEDWLAFYRGDESFSQIGAKRKEIEAALANDSNI